MERMNVSFPYLNFFFPFGAIFQRERIHLAQGRKISSIFIFMLCDNTFEMCLVVLIRLFGMW